MCELARRIVPRNAGLSALLATAAMLSVPILYPISASARKLCTGSGVSPPAAVTVAQEPTILTYRSSKDAPSGWLVVAASGIEWSELTLRPQPLSFGANRAFVTFANAPDAQVLNLGDPRIQCPKDAACRIEFKLTEVTAHGTYAGQLDVASDCGKLATVTVNALFDAPVFDPTLTGDGVKGNLVDFDATEDSAFAVTVSAPAATPQRTYSITADATTLVPVTTHWWQRIGTADSCDTLSKNTTALFSPSTFQIDGGGSQSVLVKLPACLAGGTYRGFLHVSDGSNPSLKIDRALSIEKHATLSSRRFALLCWVVLGAIVSLIVNNIFPINRARHDRFNALNDLKNQIGSGSAISAALTASMMAEYRRIWLVIDGISVLDSRKDALLQTATQALQALSKLVEVAARINALRLQADLLQLPIRIQLLIDGHLKRADDALVDVDLPGAEANLGAANQMVRAEPQLVDLVTAMKLEITKLVAERGNDKAPSCRPTQIRTIINQLKEDLGALDAMSKRDALAVERDLYIADTWTDVVEFAWDGDREGMQPVLDTVLTVLVATPASANAQRLLALLQARVSPLDLEKALETSGAKINCNESPRYFDLVDFQFAFNHLAFQSLPAARDVLVYQWAFGDDTASTDSGASCKHFYMPPKRSKWRIWARGTKPGAQSVSLTVTLPTWGKSHTITKPLKMRPADRSASLAAMQIATFVITTSVAVLASFGAQYASSLPASIDWGVGVTAFLFGFGIDQLRDRTASA